MYNVDLYAQAATQLLSAARNGDIATVTSLMTIQGGVPVNVTDTVSRQDVYFAFLVCLLRVDR